MIVNSATPLVRPAGPDGMQWPVYLADARRAFPNVSFSLEQPEENLVEFGYFPLLPGTPPQGDVVTKLPPELVDGKWVQQYDVRSFTDEEIAQQLTDAKNNAFASLDNLLNNTYGAGYFYDFVSGETTVQHHFSLTADNQQLMTGLHLLAKQETNAERLFTLRTVENLTVKYTPAQVVEMTTALMEHIVAVLEKLWDLMDDIALAEHLSELPVIPDTLATA